MGQAYFETSRKDFIAYSLVVILFIGSYFVNVDKGDTFNDIALNYLMPALLLFVGLSVKGIPKLVGYLSVLLGSILLVYLALYYITGFHNHHWGN